MKHAFIPNVPPHIQNSIIGAVTEVGDNDWTVHQNMVVEYPDDRSWGEVEDKIHSIIEQDGPLDTKEEEDQLQRQMLFILLSRVEEHETGYLLGCESHR